MRVSEPSGGMQVTVQWWGKAVVTLFDHHSALLVDPFVLANPGCPRWLLRFPWDGVFISHGHPGHVGDLAQLLAYRSDVPVITHPLLAAYLARRYPAAHVVGEWRGVFRGWEYEFIPVPHPPIPQGIDVGDAPGEPNCAIWLEQAVARYLHFGDLERVPDSLSQRWRQSAATVSLVMIPLHGRKGRTMRGVRAIQKLAPDIAIIGGRYGEDPRAAQQVANIVGRKPPPWVVVGEPGVGVDYRDGKLRGLGHFDISLPWQLTTPL